MKYLKHKGYTGTIEYSEEDEVLYGKVLGLQSLISYEGETGKELEADFKSVVDQYLTECELEGIEPEKAFKGNFNVRIPTTLHQKAALIAMEAKMSLNSFVAESIRASVLKQVS